MEIRWDLAGAVSPSDIKLVMTCSAFPGQYEAFVGAGQVGYLRLRHGNFTVEVPGAGGELVYEASPSGDGDFEDYERDRYLESAKRAIAMYWSKRE